MKHLIKGLISCLVIIGVVAGCHAYRSRMEEVTDKFVTFQGTIHHIQHTSAYDSFHDVPYLDTLHYSDIEVKYDDNYSFIRCLCAVDAEEGDTVDCGFTIKHLGSVEYVADGYIIVNGVKYYGKWYNDRTTRGERPVY